jgi:hypothetical protein
MNGTVAASITVLAALMITPAVMAKEPTCTVASIDKNQVVLQCATTEGLQPKAQVNLKPAGKKSLEGC